MDSETVDFTCGICKNPTFICKCDSSWVSFYETLKNGCSAKNDPENNFQSTDLSISTMTVCFQYNQHINLDNVNETLTKWGILVKRKKDAKKSKIKKKKGTDVFYNPIDIKLVIVDREKDIRSNTSIFVFPNGYIKVAGVKTINTIGILTEELTDIFLSIPDSVADPESFAFDNVKIQMINTDFKVKPIVEDTDGWCLKQEDLKNILVNEHYLSATYSTLAKYQGINLKIPSIIENDKNTSVFIFRSGSILITGAKNMKDIAYSYQYITEVISANSAVLFYHDINEEIKQKKKKKKLLGT